MVHLKDKSQASVESLHAGIQVIAVIGVGTMGTGIAQVFAQAGYQVRIWDFSREQLLNCRRRIESNQTVLTAKKILSAETAVLSRERIQEAENIREAISDADLIIEAVPEIIGLKKDIFAQLDEFAPEDTILASNTSGLSITDIASATTRPEKVLGMNWWNPPHIVPLVEIIKAKGTSEQTIEMVFELTESINKTPVLVRKEVPGYIGNRIQFAILREAFHLLEAGIASAEDIDTAISMGVGFRLPVAGPFQIADFGGLDVFLKVSENLFRQLSNALEPSELLKRHVRGNELGIKTGKGIYNYGECSVEQLIKARDEHLIEILKMQQGGNVENRNNIR